MFKRLQRQYDEPANKASLEIFANPLMILLEIGSIGVQTPFAATAFSQAKALINQHYGENSEAYY